MPATILAVIRYHAESLHKEFGVRFQLVGSSKELHRTPFGTTQRFFTVYAELSSLSAAVISN